MSPSPPLRTLIVDDESLARSRLRNLLADCQSPPAEVVADARGVTVSNFCSPFGRLALAHLTRHV